MQNSAPESGFLGRVLQMRAAVIGALIMREVHTRYGRANIGYLWVFVEPMLLATAVAAIHTRTHGIGGINMVAVAICGYTSFILFRSIVSRSEGVLEGNRPLLYHRQVTLLDMLVARSLLESGSNLLAFGLLISAAIVFGYAQVPARPLAMIGGYLLMAWFSFAVSLIVCPMVHASHVAARLLHPILYLVLPASGAFVLTQWVPGGLRPWYAWFPLTQIEELIRYGQFANYATTWFHVGYLLFVSLALTFVGLLCLRAIRSHIVLD
jgi:capsular polysaccharide transport system permease protein